MAHDSATRPDAPLAPAWPFALAILGYFALQAGLRLASGPALEFDEAEAFWYARSLSWGYNAQPPLYFWLVHAAFALFGPSLLALTVLKNALFAATLVSVFVLFRRIAAPVAPAATLALGLLGEVVWEMQRDRTHTVLLVLLVALTALHLLRHLTAPRRGDALILGLLIGMGVLSKPNFLFFALGLLLAARQMAGAGLRARHLVVAALVALILIAPWGAWALTHPLDAGASLGKLGLSAQTGPILQRLAGSLSFATSLTVLLLLPALVLAALWAGLRSTPAPDGAGAADPALGLLIRASLYALALGLAAVLVSGATQVQSRWLLPAILLLPSALLARVALRLAQTGRPRLTLALTLALALPWLAAFAVLPFANRNDMRHADFTLLRAALPAAPGQPVLSFDTLILGNLRLVAPDLPLARLAQNAPRPPAGTRVTLIGARDDLAKAATMGYAIDPSTAHPFELTYGKGHRSYMLAEGVSQP